MKRNKEQKKSFTAHFQCCEDIKKEKGLRNLKKFDKIVKFYV